MDIAMNRRTFVGGAVAAGVAAATVKAAPLAQADENVVDADSPSSAAACRASCAPCRPPRRAPTW